MTLGSAGVVVKGLEAELAHRVRLHPEVVDLPFARHRRPVAGVAQDARDGRVAAPVVVGAAAPARDVPMVHPAVPEGVLPREERKPGGGALRHHVEVLEAGAAGGEGVEVGRADVLGAVGGDPLLAEGVEQDEDQVRPWVAEGLRRGKRSREQAGE